MLENLWTLHLRGGGAFAVVSAKRRGRTGTSVTQIKRLFQSPLEMNWCHKNRGDPYISTYLACTFPCFLSFSTSGGRLLLQQTPSYLVVKLMWILKVILSLLISLVPCGPHAELFGRYSTQWANTWAAESSGLGFFLPVPYHFVEVDKPRFSHLPNGDNSSSTCSFVTIQWRRLAQLGSVLVYSMCSINVSFR